METNELLQHARTHEDPLEIKIKFWKFLYYVKKRIGTRKMAEILSSDGEEINEANLNNTLSGGRMNLSVERAAKWTRIMIESGEGYE